VTTPVEPVPAFRVDGLSESVDNVDGGGAVDIGLRVKPAVSVTPPPLTEMVTTVCVETATVEMMKPPAAANCGTITELGTWTRSGRELESEKVTSPFRGSAAVTRPFEPWEPDVTVGSSVSEVGAGWGVRTVDPFTDTPFHVAVIVTVVFWETGLVGIEKLADSTPAGTVTVAGG
jgi:hypothetical protein